MRYLTSALVAAAALALTATATVAQPVSQDGSAPLDRNNLHTIICKQYSLEGTRIGQKMICLTNAEWNEVHRQAREGVMLEEKKSYAPGRI